MMNCEYFENEMKRADHRPLAVDIGWFMLGILLLSSFDAVLVELTGVVLAAIGGYPLFRRIAATLCCTHKAYLASRDGEHSKQCH